MAIAMTLFFIAFEPEPEERESRGLHALQAAAICPVNCGGAAERNGPQRDS